MRLRTLWRWSSLVHCYYLHRHFPRAPPRPFLLLLKRARAQNTRAREKLPQRCATAAVWIYVSTGAFENRGATIWHDCRPGFVALPRAQLSAAVPFPLPQTDCRRSSCVLFLVPKCPVPLDDHSIASSATLPTLPGPCARMKPPPPPLPCTPCRRRRGRGAPCVPLPTQHAYLFQCGVEGLLQY